MDRIKLLLTLALLTCFAASAWAVDLSESFDETTFPPIAWQSVENGDGSNLWIRTTLNTNSGPAKAADVEEDLAGGEVAARWLITPKLHVNNITDEISFWVRTQYSFVVDNDSLYVMLSTTDSLPASFSTVLAQYKCGSGGAFQNVYQNYALNLASYVGQDVFVAFLHRDEGTGGNQLYLDDVSGPELLAPPKEASTPTPEDGAVGISGSTNLDWVNGAGTTTLDLYLAQTVDSVDNNEAVAKKLDNVAAVTTYNPPTDLLANTTYYWKVVTRNIFGATEGPVWSFTVMGAPLSGSYDIGGGNNDYANFNEAVAALYGNTITGPVTFNVYGTDYEERIVFDGPIVGASAVNRVTFSDASGTARILDSSATTSSVAVVQLTGASYITWDGVDVWASVETDNCVQMQTGCTENIFENCLLQTHDASTVSHSIRMFGNGNDNNVFSGLDCRNGVESIYLSSGSSPVSSGIIIENCSTVDCDKSLYVSNCNNMTVRNCDFQANGNGSSEYVVDISTIGSGNSIELYGNRLHNLVSTGTIAFLRANGGSGSTIDFHDNFMYDIFSSGTGTAYGIYGSSGHVNYYYNSMNIGDPDGTGSVYGYYKSSSLHTCNIQNNIFAFAESTEETDAYRGLSSGYYPDVLDNNAYYNNGGADFQVFDVSAEEYATVADLAAATNYESFGVEGDPGFVSATDLHILNTFGLVSDKAAPIPGLTMDVDGNLRPCTPDIGADEYTYLAAAADYVVFAILDPLELYEEVTPYAIQARIANIGSSAQTNVPLRLLYNGVQQDEVLVSLAAGECDTVDFTWTTPSAPSSGTLEAHAFLTGDANTDNDSAVVTVTVVAPPMHGTYDIGGGSNNYASFGAAVTALTLRGVDGAVTFNVYANTYNESVSIPAIVGASETNTITFTEVIPNRTPPEIVGASPTVQINGADYITFDNIDITCSGTGRAVEITNDADYNTFMNCAITGASVAGTSNYGAYVLGGGNDYNVFENVTVSGAYYGIRFTGTSGTPDVGNEVRYSSLMEGKYPVYLNYESDARVYGCDIQPGWNGSTTEVYGVYCTTLGSGNMCYAYDNEIHNFRTSTNSNGLYGSASTGATLVGYNNFIYDWQVTGGIVYGMRTATGSSEYYNNSVRIGDVGTTSNIYAAYVTGTSSSCTLINNILQLDVPTEECWAIYISSGTMNSNNNCVYGIGTLYNVGHSGSDYATLNDWQTATGLDLNSVEGQPGFVDATNLHLSPTFSLCNGAGQTVAIVTTDIDGETRGTPPDIGADEYEFTSLAHDYGIYGFVNLPAVFVGGLATSVEADIQNFGTNNEVDVPVRLFYNGSQTSEVLISLNAGVRDTITIPWTPPVSDYEVGDLEVQAFLGTDSYADNDSATASVTIVGPPMSGVYDLGGGNNDFATFTDAVNALTLRGIDGEVVIEAYDGTYNEALVIPEITGTNFADRVIFREHVSAALDVVTLQDGTATQIVLLDGADFITFEGIDFVCTGNTKIGVVINNDADYNTIRDCAVVGNDSASTNGRGISLYRDGQDFNLIDNVTITGVYYGVRMFDGSSTGEATDNEIRNCTISGGHYCIFLDNSPNARVHDNDIMPWGNSTVDCQGILVESQTAGDTVYVYNNRIHNFRYVGTSTSADLTGIQSRPGTSTGAVAYIYNNMIYDWNVSSGTPNVSGILCGSGEQHIYNNSIRVNDLTNGSNVDGLEINSSTANATVMNNIFVSDQSTLASWGIRRVSGTIASSNYNDIYGTGTGAYNTGRDGTTDYLTLADWQGTGNDANSVDGDPGFISNTDLHIDTLATTVNNLGTPIALVTTDIDGDARSVSTPDIGADEYTAYVAADPVNDLTIWIDPDENDVVLRWSATTNAQSYEVFVGTEFGFPLIPANSLGVTANTTFTDIDATLGNTQRYYVVVASTDPAE
ncbi:MAG: choice-of-anchor J domain-containing protein [Calditrichaeota bacterium]|nr:choice-of-anchor J domain-containing protein [Calditrichota bacterium]MCB9367660.1 choice-of-anchor J domain-containing protein [Calditrichota bacterium]